MSQRLRGMVDILPGDIALWQRVESVIRDAMAAYGYGELRTPVLERTSLFERSIGEATDIVEKEMYSFATRSGTQVTLRPENTASCVRAAMEGGLLQPGSVNRIWYLGPMFRYERPQKGRQRQFHQAGAEVYGVSGPAIEVELMLLGERIWKALGFADVVTLELNTLGTTSERKAFRDALTAYFSAHADALDEDSKRRLDTNPLRILDSKHPDMQELIAAAPRLIDHLGRDSLAWFEQVQGMLTAAGVGYQLNPRLVRGLDYYSHTVFEWTTDQLGAQAAICGGGRYDGLLEEFGVRNTPGVGWAMGLERIIALAQKLEQASPEAVPDVFVIASADVAETEALLLAEALRSALPGRRVVWNPVQASFKNQLRRADKLGARVALLLGEGERRDGTLTLKPLKADEAQQTLPRADAIARLSSILAD